MNLPIKVSLNLKTVLKDKINKALNDQNEKKIIKEGLVKKMSNWFCYCTWKLILNISGKLEYFDPLNQSGVIFLCSNCRSILKDNNRFNLFTPDRTFVFLVLF